MTEESADSRPVKYMRCSLYTLNVSHCTHLVPSLVPDQHYERPMVLLDIVVDEDGQAGIKLLAHILGTVCDAVLRE